MLEVQKTVLKLIMLLTRQADLIRRRIEGPKVQLARRK